MQVDVLPLGCAGNLGADVCADAGLFRPDECVVIAIGDLGPADDPTFDVDIVGNDTIAAKRAEVGD